MGATGRRPGAYPARMGKALLAVGGFLTVCMLLFAGAVYFTRGSKAKDIPMILKEKPSIGVTA